MTNFESNAHYFISELNQFEYHIESVDPLWDIIFPDNRGKCLHIKVSKYKKDYYVHLMDDSLCSLNIVPNQKVEASSHFGIRSFDDGSDQPSKKWNPLITKARDWLKIVKKDWIRANKEIHESYPLNKRYGIVPNVLIRSSLSDIYRIDLELGKVKTKKFIRLVEDGYFFNFEKTEREEMTASDFFEYCKIAYLATSAKNDPVDRNLSGRRMYELYADGRHEGLLDIDPNSKTEFADWLDGKHPKRERGGHPFEIRRGGNTTHISLYVSRPSYSRDEGFKVSLCGPSISRLKETICMFLAIFDAGLPISIDDPEGIRKRLLGQDNIGIIPHFDSLHRANQRFHEHENVYDVMYYDDLGRFKRRIRPFISWEPLPVLIPKTT